MQNFKRDYLQHALAVQHWMAKRGATGQVDPRTCQLELACNGRSRRFTPQFVVRGANGGIGFTPELGPGVIGFVSWLPYFNRGWPIAQDKMAFKDFAATAGVPTPAWSTHASTLRGDFLVKSRRSTLCRGQRGPFKAGTPVALAEGEYCEQFVLGRLLKAWFWNDELAAVEVVEMPSVRGNGVHTLRQLISQRLGPGDAWPEFSDELAAVQGLTLETVLPAGRSAVADYRYMSSLNPCFTVDHDVRRRISGSQVEAQLLDAGRKCWKAIPAGIQQDTMFSLDGIVDKDGCILFLEANCNPQFHPAVYELMLDRLFGK